MAQEELLERRRLTGQAADADVREPPEQAVELVGVNLARDPQALDIQVVDARQLVEADRRSRQLGRNRRPGQVTQVSEASALDRAAAPDNRDAVAERLDLGEDVARQ